MTEKTTYRKIKIIEFQRSWQTLELLQVALVLTAFLAAINSGMWRILWFIVLLGVLYATIRKIRRIRTQGLKVVIEMPQDAPPAATSSDAKTPPAQQKTEVVGKPSEPASPWFEQPYPDPDRELFPEKYDENDQPDQMQNQG